MSGVGSPAIGSPIETYATRFRPAQVVVSRSVGARQLCREDPNAELARPNDGAPLEGEAIPATG
jgi:hypothetical protein